MTAAATILREHALRIWHAAVQAVGSETLVRQALRLDGHWLVVDDEAIDLTPVHRIVVVGAGKAGAGMAAAVEGILQQLPTRARQDFTGWVNVPADCVRGLRHIKLHAARPAGLNEPTAEGVAGSEQILRLVEALTADDLCLCVLSGGGSALLPAPAPGVTLDDKQQITRFLSAAGANIQELNTVRKQLSRIKGGGLLRACRAGRLITLIISDVLGDPLDVIASGPTVTDSSTPEEALAILERFGAAAAHVAPAAMAYLERRAGNATSNPASPSTAPPIVRNIVIGNNATAVAAAGDEAERLGYSFVLDAAQSLEGEAEAVGRHLADMALRMRERSGPNCLITGGEPIVRLAPAAERGLGGRNQQLVLAALERLASAGLHGIALLSGGTDGEDGPTDAAGAFIDEQVLADARKHTADLPSPQPSPQGGEGARKPVLDITEHLRRNDAYHFFEPLGALIKTGPTHTNVCDVRVVVVDQTVSSSDAPTP
jgi:hydroxypyruvate reductase